MTESETITQNKQGTIKEDNDGHYRDLVALT